MRTAIVSDIHGNLEALEAVLADLDRERPDRVICLGDFVGYGASPNECLTRVRPRLEAAVIGNHDAAAVGRLQLTYFNHDAAEAARWTDASLEPGHRDWLLSLPYVVTFGRARYVHATPGEPAAWHYVLSPADAEEEFATFPEDVCFIGHSHYAGAFERDGSSVRYTREPELRLRPGRRWLVNVGSVGQPRDGDARAAYALFDEEPGVVRQVRVEYDVESAGRRILEAGLPPFLAERLKWGE